jgi:hypothetical protein
MEQTLFGALPYIKYTLTTQSGEYAITMRQTSKAGCMRVRVQSNVRVVSGKVLKVIYS